MGSLDKRLARLEDRSRERAAAQIASAWAQLTDEEVALVLAPYVGGISEPTPEEREVGERLRVFVPEELIATAIDLAEDVEDEEVSRRVKSLVGKLGIFERGTGIRRHLRMARERRGET